METTRQSKISRLIQKDLSELFQRECRECCQGSMVSVTVVRVSPDLSVAKVYLSIFPSIKSKDVIDAIQTATSQIRFNLGKKVGKQLRIVPELKFFIDDSLDYVANIDELLK